MAAVVESALCALRNCLAFMPPGKGGVRNGEWRLGVLWLKGWEQVLTSFLFHDSGTEPSSPCTTRAFGMGQQVG